jgi:histidinol-phosphate aminotransferase
VGGDVKLGGVELYVRNNAPSAVDLSDNTNLWGPAPAAARAIQSASAAAATLTRYPSRYSDPLKQVLAGYVGVPANCIVTGCGSDDVLDSALRAFTNPGDSIAIPEPTFHMMPIFAAVNGLEVVKVPLTRDHDVDADGMLAAGARVIYLCSPNNPTGPVFSKARVDRIVKAFDGVVIVDEAYVEYARWSAIELLEKGERVLVARTLSKAFGLAGLRVGYGVGAPELVSQVEKARGPYKVNALADAAARAALTQDLVWVRERVEEMRATRERFVKALRRLGLSVLPSAANFVLVPVGMDPVKLDAQLRLRDVAVRPFAKLPGIGDAIRITIGPWHLMQECVDALEAVLPRVERELPDLTRQRMELPA